MRTPLLPFLTVGLAEAWLATRLGTVGGGLVAWMSAATLWTAAAYARQAPAMLGKARWPRLAPVLLAPVTLGAATASLVVRAYDRRALGPGGALRVEVHPGWWVGGWPWAGAPELATLDVTAELPAHGPFLRYACVPMLDGAPMTDDAYDAAVRQLVAWRAEGHPVLVHCAHGHGRSVAVLVGALVAAGVETDWEQAHARILAVRPRARMTRLQRAVVSRRTRAAILPA
ncbi:MAG: hypothetical protein RLZZ299_183 [Pseudomonadota bacterium]|jgi:hypothetical protein